MRSWQPSRLGIPCTRFVSRSRRQNARSRRVFRHCPKTLLVARGRDIERFEPHRGYRTSPFLFHRRSSNVPWRCRLIGSHRLCFGAWAIELGFFGRHHDAGVISERSRHLAFVDGYFSSTRESRQKQRVPSQEIIVNVDSEAAKLSSPSTPPDYRSGTR